MWLRMKMALVVRTDLKMQRGKIASQCAHAAVQLIVSRPRDQDAALQSWLMQGQPKIVLKVSSLADMEGVRERADALGLPNQPIFDAGRTQVANGSLTVLGIGPATQAKIDEVVGHLKLL